MANHNVDNLLAIMTNILEKFVIMIFIGMQLKEQMLSSTRVAWHWRCRGYEAKPLLYPGICAAFLLAFCSFLLSKVL